MKTLPEILRDVMILLDDRTREYVVIERGHHEPLDGRSSAFQIRLWNAVDMGLSEDRCEARSWLGAQWSSWRDYCGWLGGGSFDTSDVLATDWRIVS